MIRVHGNIGKHNDDDGQPLYYNMRNFIGCLRITYYIPNTLGDKIDSKYHVVLWRLYTNELNIIYIMMNATIYNNINNSQWLEVAHYLHV